MILRRFSFLLLLFLFLATKSEAQTLFGRDLFTVEALGERITFEARLDMNTPKHFVRDAGLTLFSNAVQQWSSGHYSSRKTTLYVGTFIIAFEFGQATLNKQGGRFGLIDAVVGFAGIWFSNKLSEKIWR